MRIKILRIDPEKEQVSLGVKQLTANPHESHFDGLRKSEVVTCEVSAILDSGIEVVLAGGAVRGFIKKGDLSRDRADQRPTRFAVGKKVDAKIFSIDKAGATVVLSIKAKEFEKERQVMEEFGSSDSGASLGEILGVAMNRSKREAEAEALQAPEEKPKKKIKKDEDVA